MVKIFNEVKSDKRATNEEILSVVNEAIENDAGIMVVVSKKEPVCQCGRPNCKGGATLEIIEREMDARDIAMSAHTMLNWDLTIKAVFLALLANGVERGEVKHH